MNYFNLLMKLNLKERRNNMEIYLINEKFYTSNETSLKGNN